MRNLVLLLPVTLYGTADANPGVISGSVSATDASPVRFANVIVGGTNYGTMTLEDGHFKIEGVPDGLCRVNVQTYGYEPLDMVITVMDGFSTHVILVLEERPFEPGKMSARTWHEVVNRRSVSTEQLEEMSADNVLVAVSL